MRVNQNMTEPKIIAGIIGLVATAIFIYNGVTTNDELMIVFGVVLGSLSIVEISREML
jgi:hypothetical protein